MRRRQNAAAMGSPTFSFAIALVLTEAGFLVTERVFEALLMAQGRYLVLL